MRLDSAEYGMLYLEIDYLVLLIGKLGGKGINVLATEEIRVCLNFWQSMRVCSG